MFWANDHTFVIAENLACYLRTFDASDVRYVGSRLWGPCCGTFNSGAAGFALSRRALAVLASHWAGDELHKNCDPRQQRAHVATCLVALEPEAGQPVDTRDASGADIFHVYGPIRLATGAIDEWFVSKKKRVDSRELLRGPASVSVNTATFHYVAAQETRLLDDIFHRPYEEGARLGEEEIGARWPRGSDLGGYAHGWPATAAKQRLVATLLDRVELCHFFR